MSNDFSPSHLQFKRGREEKEERVPKHLLTTALCIYPTRLSTTGCVAARFPSNQKVQNPRKFTVLFGIEANTTTFIFKTSTRQVAAPETLCKRLEVSN